MTENLNILLELSESNELFFQIVSNVELKTQIQNKEKRIWNVKPKPGTENVDQCKNCSEFSTVKVFYADGQGKRPDKLFPLESIFVREEVQKKVASPAVKIPIKKEPVTVTTVRLMPVQSKNEPPALVESKIREPPRILQPVERTLVKFQCQTCEKSFNYRSQLENHVKSKACFGSMAFGNRKRVVEALSYLDLPESGLDLPDLNNLAHPYTNQILQADNTITYIHQEKVQTTLWITNFDLFGTDECDICGEPFKDYKQKLQHRRLEHFFQGSKKTCNGCEKLCATEKEQNMHQLYCLKHDQIIPYLCYDCNILFHNRASYQIHLFKKHPFSCKICKKRFKKQDSVKSHMQYAHNKNLPTYLTCAHCKYESKSRLIMQTHLFQNHFPQMAKLKCDMCSPPKYFISESLYEQHLVNDHRGVELMQESVVEVEGRSASSEQPSTFEDPEEKYDQMEEEYLHMEHDYDVAKVEVPSECPKKVLILDSDDNILVQYVQSDQPKAETTQPEVEMFKYETYPHVNTSTKLDYLPEGLVLPNLNFTNFPVKIQILQPDGTTTYINQVSQQSTLWITNFDIQTKTCELCDTSVKLIGAHLQHRVAFHFFPANSPTCIGCNQDFNSHEEKRRHTLYCLEKSSIDVAFCYICQVHLFDHLSYREHLLANHPNKSEGAAIKKISICPICECEVNLRSMTLDNHIRMHDEPKPLKCAHCPKAYGSKRALLNHLTAIHFQDLVKHICNDCSPVKHFNETVAYLKHRRRAHCNPKIKQETVEKVKCPKCPKMLTKVNLENHLKNIHNPKDLSLMYSCEECGKIFLTLKHLVSHKQTHLPDSERPYKCQFCGKGFCIRARLREHERDHTGEKPFVCTFCQKAFARKQTYKDHVNTHTGKGFKCDYCEKVLWDHSSFRKHLKTHESQLGIKLTYTKNERRWADMGLLDKVKDFM